MPVRQYCRQLDKWSKICCRKGYVLAGARAGDSVERRVMAEERYVVIVDVHGLTDNTRADFQDVRTDQCQARAAHKSPHWLTDLFGTHTSLFLTCTC